MFIIKRKKIIINEFVGLRVKNYICLTDDGREGKKPKDIKMFIIKRKLKFEDYKSCFAATQIEKIKQTI